MQERFGWELHPVYCMEISCRKRFSGVMGSLSNAINFTCSVCSRNQTVPTLRGWNRCKLYEYSKLRVNQNSLGSQSVSYLTMRRLPVYITSVVFMVVKRRMLKKM